jgi:actin-related protein
MERGYVAWIGGSILGSLTCQNNLWLSKEQLEQRLF